MQTRLAEQQAPAEQTRSAAPGADHGHPGRTPDFTAHSVAALRAALTDPRPVSSGGLLVQLQRALGNRYVQQAVARASQAVGAAPTARPKLVVGPADDRYEREADRIAREAGHRAVRRPGGPEERTHHPPTIQRMAAAARSSSRASGLAEGGTIDDGLRRAIGQARGGGRRLPAELRGSMERALGADFSRVRLHADPRADRFNRALQARAFTTGRDIFFRRGDYNPGGSRGRQLLAHELTHVVQQGGAGTAALALQREVIQRELTDEARAVLEAANQIQAGFTITQPDPTLQAFDVIAVLQKSQHILAAHLRQVMDLPQGAPAALESFVQAWLLRHLVYNFIEKALIGGPGKSPEMMQKIVQWALEDIAAVKDDVINAGYGQPGAMTPELKTVIIKYFGLSATVPLNLDAFGVQHVPAADPRKVEVCATYIPGRQFDVLGRAHSFILYTDASGKITYVSAHDDGTGSLGADFGLWSPSKFDDQNFDRLVVATGHQASAAFPAMLDAVQHINSAAIKYKMTEQNCNSATHYILKAANLAHAQAPSFMTGQFGWNKKLEKKINRPLPYYPALPLPPVTQTTATTTTAPPVPATVASTTAMPAFPQQMPVLPPPPGSVASTSTTARAFAGATVSTPRRGQPPARQQRIGATRGARPGLQPTTTSRGREEEESSSEEQVAPRGPGGTQAPEHDQDTYTLNTPVAMSAVEIAAGRRVTVLRVGRTNNLAEIQVLPNGPKGFVAKDELERAIGRRLT